MASPFPIFLCAMSRLHIHPFGRQTPHLPKEGGVLKNINISNIVATAESLIACSITGVETSYVENVSINNVQISYPGAEPRTWLVNLFRK